MSIWSDISFKSVVLDEVAAHGWRWTLGMQDERYYQRHHGKDAQEESHRPVSTVHDPHP